MKLVITAALVCHLLLAPRLVTSQLPPNDAAPPPAAQQPPAQPEETPPAVAVPGPPGAPIATIRARSQEKAGDLFDKGREYFEEHRSRLVGAFEAGRSAMKEEMGKVRSDG